MNVNMNVSTRTTPKKLDIMNPSSKTEQFKKVLDNHEFRLKILTNENATTGIEKTMAYGSAGMNLNDSEDTTELKAEIIKFIELSIDAAKQNPVNLKRLTKEEVQIQQMLQTLSSMFETQQSSLETKNKVSNFNFVDLEKMLDDNLIGVESLTPETKDKLKNSLSKIFTLIEKSDVNKVAKLSIHNVLEQLTKEVSDVNGEISLSHSNSTENYKKLRAEIINFVKTSIGAVKQNPEYISKDSDIKQKMDASVVEIQQNVSETGNQKNNLNSIDLEKMLDEHLIGVENLTPETKNTLENNLTKIFELIEESDTNMDKPLQIQNVLEQLTKQVGGVNGELRAEIINFFQTVTESLKQIPENISNDSTAKVKSNSSIVQVQQILQSLSSMFETKQNDFSSTDLEKMLDEHLIGVENLTPKTKNTLKNNLSNIVKSIGKLDENKYEPLQLQNLLKNIITEVDEVKGDLSLLAKDNISVQVAQIQHILQSLSYMFQSSQGVSMTKNQERDVSSINLEQLIGVENLTPETKNLLKRSFREIFVLVEKLETSAGAPTKILQVLQKLTTEVHKVNGDLSVLKIHSTQNVMVNSEVISIKDNPIIKDNEISANRSFEEKFLGNLIRGDKDEMKISKAVNFMNQFQDIKTLNTGKVEAPNLVVDKNNLTVDIIKSVKFMETNNIRNLTVTMSPKELGEITIKLTMESGIMKAFISAQNKDTFNLLNNNMQDISDKLKNMDIKIQSLDINIYEDSTFFSKDSNQKNNNGTQTNESKTNSVLEEKEDVLIRDNYSIEQSTVNKFV